MAGISDLEKQVLREAYPNVRFHEDLDIDRYFELRNAGQLSTALDIYNTKLKNRYPDENKRVQLLTFYRTKDPRFYTLLAENLNFLAEKTVRDIKRVIVFLTDRMSGVNLNDVFSLIRTVESLLSLVKLDRFAIIAEMEKYSRFAAILDFRSNEMKNCSELIRMYISDTISAVNEYRSEQERLKKKEQEQQKKQSISKTFDFSKITFTKEQIAEIVLPSENISIEDKVLTYIVKYWDRAFDRGFENSILLYSRKYKTRHYDVFNSVKIARERGWQDSELLQAVLSNVVSGYYYNIRGDLYLNRNWLRIKTSLLSGNSLVWTPSKNFALLENSKASEKARILEYDGFAKEKTAKTLEASAVHNARSKKRTNEERKTLLISSETMPKTNFERATYSNEIRANFSQRSFSTNPKTQQKTVALLSEKELRAEQKKQAEKYAMMKAAEKKYFSTRTLDFKANAKKQAESEKAFLERQRLEARYKDSEIHRESTRLIKGQTAKNDSPLLKREKTGTSARLNKTSKTSTSRRSSLGKTNNRTTRNTSQSKKQNTTVRANIFVARKNNNFDPATNRSIEQMIKKATGTNYVIYKDLFFKEVRNSIRYVLSATSMNKRSLFKTEQNTAENIIYVFLQRNYNNLYQNWEESNAREEVYELGFNVKSLETIINHWAKNILNK